MPIKHNSTPGLSLYVLFDDDTDGDSDGTAVDMTEGTGDNAGTYSVADTAIASASLPSGSYTFRILVGTAAGKDPTDPLDGAGDFVFDGTNETTLSDSIAALSVGATISPKTVDDQFTWRISSLGNGSAAGDRPECANNAPHFLQFDFSEILTAVITGTPTVTIGGAASLTATDIGLRAEDQKAVIFQTPTLATAGTYNVTVSCGTTDSKTVVGTGVFTVPS